VGQNAEVVGRSIYSDTLVIQLPSNPSITCWLWTQNARVAGNTSGLPFVNVPSTPTPWPTPVAAFTVVYNSTITCNGIYELKFEIENTGSVTWESDKIKATNLGTNEVVTESRNDFPNVVNGCTEPSDDQNLESGEVGYTMSGNFSTNPVGHNFSAVIHVCSEDNMNGTCMQTTITFTP
jgi:hypothetical protein